MANTESYDTQDPQAGRVLGALRRHWWIPLLTVLLAAGIAYVLTARTVEKYTATSLIQFFETALDEELLGDVPGSDDPETISATNVVLVGRPAVGDAAARELGGGVTSKQLRDQVVVSAQEDTSILRIRASDEDPERAAQVANVYAEAFIRLDRQQTRNRMLRAREVIRRELRSLPADERDSPRAYQLADRETQLNLLLGGREERVNLVQRAEVPNLPSTASPLRNTLLAALLGLVLGIGLAVLRDQSDRRMRSELELEDAFDLPLLASIPHSRALSRPHQSLDELPARDSEVFRLLQAQVRYGAEQGLGSVSVTSSHPVEGKTTVAWHFAAACAANLHVLVIEADMRRPTFASRFGVRADDGLATILADGSAPEDVIQTVDAVSGRTMDVIVAGVSDANPADLAQSPLVADLMRWAVSEYDLVVVDAPPLSVVSDAIALIKLVDAAIVVAHRDQAMPARIRRLREQLRALDVRVLGVVANGFDAADREAGYAYY